MVEYGGGGGRGGEGCTIKYGGVVLYTLAVSSIMWCEVAVDTAHGAPVHREPDAHAAFITLAGSGHNSTSLQLRPYGLFSRNCKHCI